MLDYPVGSNVIMRVFIRGSQECQNEDVTVEAKIREKEI